MKQLQQYIFGIGWVMLACLSTSAFAQDSPQAALEKMKKRYAAASSYAMSLKVDMYKSNAQTKPSLSTNGQVWRSGDKFRTEYGSLKTLSNEKCFMMLDLQRKLVVYNKAQQTEQDASSDIGALTDQFEASIPMRWGSTTGQIRSILIEPEYGLYQKVELVIDVKKHQLQKVIYHYRSFDGMPYEKVVIAYSNIRIDEAISSKTFSEKEVLRVVNGKPVLQAAYASYQLIDQSSIQMEQR